MRCDAMLCQALPLVVHHPLRRLSSWALSCLSNRAPCASSCTQASTFPIWQALFLFLWITLMRPASRGGGGPSHDPKHALRRIDASCV
jgi:hypothetical protein